MRVERSPIASPTPLPTRAELDSLRFAQGAGPAGDMYMVAQCHLDSAWLWTWRDTQHKARTTFERAVDFLGRFPDYQYTQSQAQLYAWIEQQQPALFETIREFVAAGRWHVVGGMWVEPDTNLLRGESLARQLLYGQRFLQRHLGRAARVGWLIDSFGFSAQMPQLLRAAGLDYFVTTKLLWNDTTEFPHHLFWWEALDGTRVLAYQTPDPLGRKHVPGMLGAVRRFTERSPTPHVMLLYGEGDGGNGPKLDEVWQVQLMQSLARRGLLPRVRQGGPLEYFERVGGTEGIPLCRGELYLETHRGALTTDARTKTYNRRCEETLLAAEAFSFFAGTYPRERLRVLWERLMLNQGHDSIAGTVIEASQRECHAAFREVLEGADAVLDDACRTLAPGGLTVFNPLGFDRGDVVSAALPAEQQVVGVTQQRGKDVLGREWVFFVGEEIPSLGWRRFGVAPAVAPAIAALAPAASAAPFDIETAWCRLRVDAHSGHLVSLCDKRAGERELLAGEGNVLQLFVDRPRRWDAWNIDASTLQQPPQILSGATSVQRVESGPLRHVIRTERATRRSRFVCHIVVWENLPRIDFELWVDWREVRRLLKVAFPLTLETALATYEVPFGAVERSTRAGTPAQAAQFEVPLLRWMDLSAAGYGVALLNDGRYGGDVRGNVMRLSLLRGATYPPRLLPELVAPLMGRRDVPTVDRGEHVARWSLLPHFGDWREAGVVQQAAAFNQPLRAACYGEPDAARAASASRGAWEGPAAVMLESLKAAEDDEACVIRLYESAGRVAAGTWRGGGGMTAAYQCDLLERPQQALAVTDGGVRLQFRPYEIKTLRLESARR